MKVSFSGVKRPREDVDRGVQVQYGPPKRAFLRWRWYGLLLVLSSPLLFLFWRVVSFYAFTVAPGVLVLDRITLSSPAAGVVETLPHREGDPVRAGELLFYVSDPSRQQRFQALMDELTALEGARLEPRVPRPNGGSDALYRANRENLRRQMEYLKSVETLFRAGAATRAELEEALGRVQSARVALAQSAIAPAPVVLDPGIQQYEAQRRARIAQLRGQIKALEESSGGSVYAPEDGVVLEIMAHKGQGVLTGSPVLVLGALKDVKVMARLDPRKLQLARPGQQVKVRFPDGQRVDGRILRSPSLTSSDPSMESRSLLVPVELKVPLDRQDRVDSLPVTVEFPLCVQELCGLVKLVSKALTWWR